MYIEKNCALVIKFEMSFRAFNHTSGPEIFPQTCDKPSAAAGVSHSFHKSFIYTLQGKTDLKRFYILQLTTE